MNIETLFDFLVKEYGLSYSRQKFINCYGGSWKVETHSFYSDTGCFTIYIEFQRGVNFWYASRFSTECEKLCEKEIDVYSLEPHIWDAQEKIWIFNRPFFWWSDKKVLRTLAEVLKEYLAKGNDFFGIHRTGNTGDG